MVMTESKKRGIKKKVDLDNADKGRGKNSLQKNKEKNHFCFLICQQSCFLSCLHFITLFYVFTYFQTSCRVSMSIWLTD